MIRTKMFSTLVSGAFVTGIGLIAVNVMIGSEFIRELGAFPLLLAMFLLPHAFLEWEAPRVGHLGNPPTDKGAHLGPSAATEKAATTVQPLHPHGQ